MASTISAPSSPRTLTRPMLVASALVALGAFAASIALSGSVSTGSASAAWVGLIGMCLAGATLFGAVVAFVHAGRMDRNGPLWAVGSFLFPYAAPLILAFLPPSGRVAVQGGAPPAGSTPGRAAAPTGDLRSVLLGKWICPCGVIHSRGRDGEICSECGKSLLRFHPAERGQSCAACGFRFSDVEVTIDDTMQEVWARKGFRCNACGESLCLSCLPVGDDGEVAFRCRCGGSVAIRI